ncbi:MAG: bifunctional 5,10-methylene-tetrahydrofolate dehydrogenase/5,10-methylene-tetrahydrofolate cyclohydrolase, partial [Synechococcaceae bacterium WB9_3_282]|nr:bifunctional 5,10-methylene-tetrahydrofolate dehydrogenase/5,10-methylene-tetrahydrofolate cyclohydrolase [Synechococcaceae bacterium WBA_3_309]NDE23132.1 bifunctional 5,10-methylene-tetrahydrofolate dehydrogenase/5,10-methylene-tetrahydrofolate cyclohydrolase [Synechococcaceae bacterium WB9_3_282]
MAAQRLDGRLLAAQLETSMAAAIAAGLAKAGRPPGLAVLRVGDDPASAVYVANKEKACARIGAKSFGSHLPANISQAALELELHELNKNPAVDGILVQLPVPASINDRALLQVLDPN